MLARAADVLLGKALLELTCAVLAVRLLDGDAPPDASQLLSHLEIPHIASQIAAFVPRVWGGCGAGLWAG